MLAPQTSQQVMEVGQRIIHYHAAAKAIAAMTLVKYRNTYMTFYISVQITVNKMKQMFII